MAARAQPHLGGPQHAPLGPTLAVPTPDNQYVISIHQFTPDSGSIYNIFVVQSRYFWERLFKDVLSQGVLASKTVSLWEAWDLSIFNGPVPNSTLPWDPAKPVATTHRRVETPPGTVFNLYTSLNCVLNETAALGVPAVLSAPWYLDDTLITHEYGGDSKGSVRISSSHHLPSIALADWTHSDVAPCV